jgi:Asp-tRNA(Asn)/Glu-tRNA(Gln) amidotransferase A subunit family amidase
MMPLALGTQTGGSIIRPASFCGIVGFKPSFGMISRHGIKPLSESLDTAGVLARTVEDAALLVSVLARRAALRDLDAVEPPRVGVWRTWEWDHAAPETRAAVEAAARSLQAAGARVVEADLPAWLAHVDHAHHAIERFEMVDALAFERTHHPDLLSDALRARLDQAAQVAPELYAEQLAFARSCRRALEAVFGAHDVLLAPSAVGEAPPGLASTGSAVFNRGWTLLRVPCVTLPAARGPQGLPVGVQLVGAYGEDRKLLSIARWTERVLGDGAR